MTPPKSPDKEATSEDNVPTLIFTILEAFKVNFLEMAEKVPMEREAMIAAFKKETYGSLGDYKGFGWLYSSRKEDEQKAMEGSAQDKMLFVMQNTLSDIDKGMTPKLVSDLKEQVESWLNSEPQIEKPSSSADLKEVARVATCTHRDPFTIT